MKQYKQYLLKQQKNYPSMEIEDYFKLVYQSHYGPKHLLNANVEENILEELKENLNDNDILYEYISNDFVRVNLSLVIKDNIHINGLTSIITKSANYTAKGSITDKINLLYNFGLNKEKIDDFLQNPQPVYHSETYKKLYNPHYRVVSANLLPLYFKKVILLDFIESLQSSLKNDSEIKIVAIEGKCCSGKSTLADLITNATIIHADDFFSDSTSLDFKRIRNVLSNLKPNQSFTYEVYNCMTDYYYKKTIDCVKNIVVLEGVYSYHQELRDLIDKVVYVNSIKEIQMKRLEDRCKHNKELFDKFINLWIPREDEYYDSYDFILNSDLIV